MITPIQSRATDAVDVADDTVVPIEELVRHFAVQNFIQALMGGDPELTGIPDLTAEDG